jgi:hypothetical protein
MQAGLGSWYHSDLRSAFPRRVVAKALGGTKEEQEFILTVFDRMNDWASQEYEGKPIPAALGIDSEADSSTIKFADVCKEEFSPVLTNGFDTMLVCSPVGNVVGFKCLDGTPNKLAYAPCRLAGVAEWTSSGRIAVALNRVGEILVFTHGELRFVRRRGRWHFLTHSTIITQMRRPASKAVRRAVYETCLDASFAKTGACIGVVTPPNKGKWKQVVTEKADWWWPATSLKAKTLELMTEHHRFYALDRRLRQELVAIDGATVLDSEGRILAVGAILKIDGGSSGGGRLAAAKELSKLGLGIKVSQDGGIRGFHDGNKEEAFIVM